MSYELKKFVSDYEETENLIEHKSNFRVQLTKK